jgi:hypothetical protein
MNQQVRDFLEFAGIRDFKNIVAAIMQIIAATADGTQSGIAGGDTGQCNGFFWLEASWGLTVGH